MWSEPTKNQLEMVPGLYETEEVPLKDKHVYIHFFMGGCDWYVTEYDGDDLFFGYVVLNNDFENSEWGYFSFSELKNLKSDWLEVECESDEYWEVKPASEIPEIIFK